MRLIDADKLIEQGYILTKHGKDNQYIGSKSIADVPTAFDLEMVLEELDEEHQTVMREEKRCNEGDKRRLNYLVGKHVGIVYALDIIKEGLEDE